MIVLDASIVVELLTDGSLADVVRDAIGGRSEAFIVPHLVDVEVISALRKLALLHRLDEHRRKEYLGGLAALPAQRFAHTPLLGRMWELRTNFTAYDAAYIALAEATDSILYTSDEKLCKGHRARVVLFRH